MNKYILQLRDLNDNVVLNGHEVYFPSDPPKILLVDNIPYLRKFVIDAYPTNSDDVVAMIGYSQSDIGIIHLPENIRLKS